MSLTEDQNHPTHSSSSSSSSSAWTASVSRVTNDPNSDDDHHQQQRISFSLTDTTTTTRPKFRGFSPPRWIFSHPDASTSSDSLFKKETMTQSRSQALVSSDPIRETTIRHGNYHERESSGFDKKEELFPSYGPKLKPISFVKASTSSASGSRSGPGQLEDLNRINRKEEMIQKKGYQVRNLYESLVGLDSEGKGKTRDLPSRTEPKGKDRVKADIDLTELSSSDDEEEEEEQQDPDMIILTRSTCATRRRRKPLIRSIHELLPSSTNPHEPLVRIIPPVHYSISSTSIGWKLLERQGWKSGQGLGPVITNAKEGEKARGLIVPLKASEKFDRKGLGIPTFGGETAGKKMTREEKQDERKRKEMIEIDKRGKGKLGIEKKRKIEEKSYWVI